MVIDKKATECAWKIWDFAQTEEGYAKMLEKMRPVDAEYEAILSKLPVDQRDIISEFVCQCEEMSWRLLEIACAMLCASDGEKA